MCIVILSLGKDTHTSLFIGIMQGEYDDQQQWLFQGEVTMQTCMEWDYDTTLTFDDTVQYEC